MVEDAARQIDWGLCTHCLQCVGACIYESLNGCGKEMTVAEVVAEVLRDEVFYETSQGGVTISGGEALSQGEFLHGLLEASKKAGLHTALDTSGLAPWRVLERVLPLIDLLLYDVKHLESQAHLKMTGVPNEQILANLRKATGRARIWLRLPLIHGFNDSEEHVRGLIELAKEVDAEKISLLPYHLGGESKCQQIGRAYEFYDGRAPDPERVAVLKDLIEQSGVKASVSS
jgi:pyruvate formate lyase activating enzyme